MDTEPDPVIRALQDIRRDVVRLTWATALLYLVLAAALAAALWFRGNDLEQQNIDLEKTAEENRRAADYMCQVGRLLDDAIASAAKQIRAAREDGTYDRLLALGVITRESLNETYRTEESYRATHALLANPAACEKIQTEGGR